MVDAEEFGLSLLDQIIEGGIVYAGLILSFSLLLFIQGGKRLSFTLGTAGFLVGYGMSYLFVDQFNELGLSLNDAQFQLLAGVLVAIGAMSIAQIAARFLAAGMVYLAVTRLIYVGDSYGYDFEGDTFLSGILTLVALIFSLSFRRLVPAVLAAAMGSLGILFSVYLGLGWDVYRLDGGSLDVYLAAPLMIVSCYIQFKYFMADDDELDDEEKDYDF